MKLSNMFKKFSMFMISLVLVGSVINTYRAAGEVKAEEKNSITFVNKYDKEDVVLKGYRDTEVRGSTTTDYKGKTGDWAKDLTFELEINNIPVNSEVPEILVDSESTISKPSPVCVESDDSQTKSCTYSIGVLSGDTSITVLSPHKHKHNDELVFDGVIKDLDDFKYAIANGGNWYLENDIVIDKYFTIYSSDSSSKPFYLCLNGKQLNMQKVNDYSAVKMDTIIDDCTEVTYKFEVGTDGLWALNEEAEGDNARTVTGGVITGNKNSDKGVFHIINGATLQLLGGNFVGNSSDQGGAIYVDQGTFEMSGGSIVGNTARMGSAIYLNGGTNAAFIMNGGRISNNVSSMSMGGAVVAGWSGAKLEFSGNAVITENLDGSKKPSNVMLDQAAMPSSIELDEPATLPTTTNLITIGSDGLKDAKIGVSTSADPNSASNVIFAYSEKDYHDNFTPDTSGYYVIHDDESDTLQFSVTEQEEEASTIVDLTSEISDLITIEGNVVTLNKVTDGDYVYQLIQTPIAWLPDQNANAYIEQVLGGVGETVIDASKITELTESIVPSFVYALTKEVPFDSELQVTTSSVVTLYRFNKENVKKLDNYFCYPVYGVYATIIEGPEPEYIDSIEINLDWTKVPELIEGNAYPNLFEIEELFSVSGLEENSYNQFYGWAILLTEEKHKDKYPDAYYNYCKDYSCYAEVMALTKEGGEPYLVDSEDTIALFSSIFVDSEVGNFGEETGAVYQGEVESNVDVALSLVNGDGEGLVSFFKLGTVADIEQSKENATNPDGGKPTPVKPTITTQPVSSLEVEAGSISGSLSMVATGSDLSYQWYQAVDANKTTATAITGAISATFDIPKNLGAGTYYYYCTVSLGSESVDTSVTTIVVTEKEEPGDNTATGGDLPGKPEEPIVPVRPSKPTTAVGKLNSTTSKVETIITSGTVEEVNKVVEATLATDYLNVEINDNGVKYSATDAEKYDVRIDNLNTAVTAILTDDEIVQAASGKLNASILLETEMVIVENISDTTKTKIGDATPVGYQLKETVDISLYKILGSEKTQIKETSAGIEVTMELPESIRNEKDIKIIRIHNEGTPEEEATVLTSVVNGDGTITFITDKFSTYAFVTSDMDLSAYSNFGLEVYHNSRVISVENTKNGFDVSGYMWVDYVTPTKNTWREIIFVNTEDASTDKAYRMNTNAVYNTFLNTNMYATRDGKVDLSYACYKANVNTNSISSYDKKTTGKMASGTYYAFMRISDGKDSYLFPLVDRVLSDGSTLTLPENFNLGDDLTRTLVYTVK